MQEKHHGKELHLVPPPFLLGRRPAPPADPLPHVPAMISTRLQLELLLQECFIDLAAVSQVILSDPGATLQMLRLIGEEYPSEEDRPTRIEDCIASLSMDCWYEFVCGSSMALDSGVLAEWEKSRRVAQCAKELARCVEGFAPDEAYLVGLLRQVGKFPHLLGWKATGSSSDEQTALGVMLADYWHLPAYLLRAIREEQECVVGSRWGEILQMAECAACRLDPAQSE